MSKSIISDEKLTAIGDAIRSKNDATDKYTPDEMVNEINKLNIGDLLDNSINNYSPVLPVNFRTFDFSLNYYLYSYNGNLPSFNFVYFNGYLIVFDAHITYGDGTECYFFYVVNLSTFESNSISTPQVSGNHGDGGCFVTYNDYVFYCNRNVVVKIDVINSTATIDTSNYPTLSIPVSVSNYSINISNTGNYYVGDYKYENSTYTHYIYMFRQDSGAWTKIYEFPSVKNDNRGYNVCFLSFDDELYFTWDKSSPKLYALNTSSDSVTITNVIDLPDRAYSMIKLDESLVITTYNSYYKYDIASNTLTQIFTSALYPTYNGSAYLPIVFGGNNTNFLSFITLWGIHTNSPYYYRSFIFKWLKILLYR